MFRWISVIKDCLYTHVVGGRVAERFVKSMRGLEPSLDRIGESLPAIIETLSALDRAREGSDYLTGAKLSLAERFLTLVLHYFRDPPEGTRVLHAALGAWMGHMETLEGYARTNTLGPK